MAFVVLCAPKSLEVSSEDHHLHARHARAQELQEDLTALLEPDAVQEIAKQGLHLLVREGGVAAALGPEPQDTLDVPVWIAARDERIAVFKGTLKNLKALEAKFLLPTQAAPDSDTTHEGGEHPHPHAHAHHHAPPMPPVPETAPAPPPAEEGTNGTNGHSANGTNGGAGAGGGVVGGNPAAVVLAAYDAVGAVMLSQLQGRFAMCMFDAQQMRVLAARDGSGALPLLQARTPRGGLVLTTCPAMLACCHDTLEFEPGFFKYGWLAAPRLFTPQALQHPTSGHTTPRRSLDHHAPHHPHHPHSHLASGSKEGAAGGSASSSRRASLDHATGGRGNGHSQAHPQPVRPGGNNSRRTSLDHPTPPPHNGGRGGGSTGGGSSSKGPAASSLMAECAADARGNQSPSSSTSSGPHSGQAPRRRGQGQARPESGGGGAPTVAAVASGLSHLRVEAAPFVPGGAAGAAEQHA